MTHGYLFRAGEASVAGQALPLTAAVTEVLIGDVAGPVGHAFASLLSQNLGYIQANTEQIPGSFNQMMGQAKGCNRLFAVCKGNQMVRPSTIAVCKSSVRNKTFEELFGGVMQPAVADAVLDAVIEGNLPRPEIDTLCIIALVWLDPACADATALDTQALYQSNYIAAKLAIQRAMSIEPSVDELIANRQKTKETECCIK